MQVELTKVNVGRCQANTAIELFFSGGDIVSIHTLGMAAANIFGDVLRAKGAPSWRDEIVRQSPLSEAETMGLVRRSSNFFKHADRDPDATMHFSDNENDHVLWLASVEYGFGIRAGLFEGPYVSTQMSVFLHWYIADKADGFGDKARAEMSDLISNANKLFPRLAKKDRSQRILAGSNCLAKELDARFGSLGAFLGPVG